MFCHLVGTVGPGSSGHNPSSPIGPFLCLYGGHVGGSRSRGHPTLQTQRLQMQIEWQKKSSMMLCKLRQCEAQSHPAPLTQTSAVITEKLLTNSSMSCVTDVSELA